MIATEYDTEKCQMNCKDEVKTGEKQKKNIKFQAHALLIGWCLLAILMDIVRFVCCVVSRLEHLNGGITLDDIVMIFITC